MSDAPMPPTLRGSPARRVFTTGQPLAPEVGLRPVRLECRDQFLDDRFTPYDDADFAPLVQFEPSQALTADERVLAVADDGADVQTVAGKCLMNEPVAARAHFADDPDVDALLRAFLEQADDPHVADLRIVDEQLRLRLADERGQLLSRRTRTDDERAVAGVSMPLAIGLEQLDGGVNGLPVVHDDAEAAAPRDIDHRVVESEHEELPAIDDHELAVIADEVVAGAVDRRAGAEQTLFELPQSPRSAFVGVGDERMDVHAARDGRVQRVLDVVAVESEDDQLDAALRAPDRGNQRCDAVPWLNQQLHAITGSRWRGARTAPSPRDMLQATRACRHWARAAVPPPSG